MRSPIPFPRRSSAGFSLIETMIAVGICTVVSAAFISLISNMHNETRSMSDKIEALDVERQLSQLLSENSLCSCNVVDQGPLVADPATPTGSVTYHVDLAKIGSSCADPTKTFAVPGQRMFAGATALIVKRIAVRYLTPTGRVDTTGAPNQYSGAITVEFEPTSTGRQMQAIKTTKIFNTQANKLLACLPPAVTGATTEYYQGADVTSGAVASASVQSGAWCPAGYRATGGGMQSDLTTPCTPSTLLESRMVQHASGLWGWVTRATCQTYHAVVACQREL